MVTPVSLSEPEWLLLHEVRLRGFVVATDEHLTLIEQELITHKATMVALTPQGRSLHESWARIEPDSAAGSAVARLHEGFDDLNRELLTVCSAWQVRPGGAPNDHLDATYDWQVIDRLERLHERTGPRLRRVARDASRFESYDRRLWGAVRKVIDDGATEWFTSPRIDSYHTVWNQLHEDLLLALGIDRNA
jgi:hypothetical protein